MRVGLVISIGLNLVLAGVLALRYAHPAPPVPAVPPARANTRPAAVVSTPEVSPTAPPAVAAKPLRWSQLESSADYRAYVANLRAAGCPEDTLADIVRGDVERAFYGMRRQLHLTGQEPGPWSGQAQVQMTAYLLGESSATADAGPAAAAARNGQPIPASLSPLALQDVDLDALGLSNAQKERVAEIRQEFIENLGGTNQDPSDPAYLLRWRKAQRLADDDLRGLLGFQGMSKFSLAAGEANGQTP